MFGPLTIKHLPTPMGGGTQKYTRVCDDPKPSCGGKECKGPSSNSKSCNGFCCPGKICNNNNQISSYY